MAQPDKFNTSIAENDNPQASSPDTGSLIAMLESIRTYESAYGSVPNTDLTKQRLLDKLRQDLSQRGEMTGMQGSPTEAHPILADSAYFSGIDQAVNHLLEFMTEEEAQRYAEQLQYQQRKQLEKQMALSSAPTLTRG